MKKMSWLGLVCLLLCQFVIGASALGNQLNPKDEKNYRILVVPDANLAYAEDTNFVNYIEAALRYHKAYPYKTVDMVVFLGDMTRGTAFDSRNKLEHAVRNLLKPLTAQGTPFLVVFGTQENDATDRGLMSRADLVDLYREIGGKDGEGNDLCQNHLAQEQYADLSGGVTNFSYLVYRPDGTPYLNLVGFDIGSRANHEEGYPYAYDDQVAWFEDLQDKIVPAQRKTEDINEETGTAPGGVKIDVYDPDTGFKLSRDALYSDVTTLVFQHIPMPEICEYLVKTPNNQKFPGSFEANGRNYFRRANNVEMKGVLLQDVRVGRYDRGLFKVLTKHGNVRSVYFGNNPMNNYIVRYDRKNMELVQLPGVAWNSIPGAYMVRGATNVRVFSERTGQLNSTHDLFTYRQASRVEGSKVTSAVNGTKDWITIFPYSWQKFVGTVTAPFLWKQEKNN